MNERGLKHPRSMNSLGKSNCVIPSRKKQPAGKLKIDSSCFLINLSTDEEIHGFLEFCLDADGLREFAVLHTYGRSAKHHRIGL